MFILPYLAIAWHAGVAAHRVSVVIDASNSLGPLPQTSRFFGCDEPNEATQLNGSALIKELGEFGPSQTFFRTHNLLTTGDGSPRLKWGSTNAYTEDEFGNPIYNWTIVDKIFDTYLERNVKPYAQIGFMPKALSTNPDPYEFYFDETPSYNVIFTGWSYPPTSYQKWAELIYQWVKHSVESWNEPNIPYFNGTEAEFFILHYYAVDAVRRALPTARIGGPEIAGRGTGASGNYLRQFLQHTVDGQNIVTGEIGTELDFISFHAKGSPIYINATAATPGHLQMNLSAALQNARDAFIVIKEFPTIEHLPVIIGEDDPDGCAACASPAYGYRNGIVFPSYTAESFVRQLDLAAGYGIDLQGTLTWAFEYDGRKYFDGLRVLTTNGIDKPILNVFRMFGKMTGDRVMAESSAQLALKDVVANSVQKATDVGVLASSDESTGKIAVMIWHYHDDDLPKPDAQIEVDVHGLAKNCKSVELTHYRIDDNHSNSYTTWLDMGSPQQPTTEQYETLRTAGQLQTVGRPQRVRVKDGKLHAPLSLPIHGTSLLLLER
ncbi:hypothetical protein LTR95_002870 [Oleoguttula sp. CCFEE 5521]